MHIEKQTDVKKCDIQLSVCQICEFRNTLFQSISEYIEILFLVFIWIVVSPLLDFVQELSENRPSEVTGQTAGHIISDEGFNDSLSERKCDIEIIKSLYI